MTIPSSNDIIAMSVMAIIKRGEKFMELAAKIFIIIGMITGAMAILPLIFGFIVLNKMKNINFYLMEG